MDRRPGPGRVLGRRMVYLWHHGRPRTPPPGPPITFPPFPSFSIGSQATAYEWMMLWNDREPYAPWFGVDGENPNDADRRWHLMVTFAEEAILNLAHDIKAGAVPLVKRAYRRNRRGETELDITRCVIGREAMLDFAKRIGGYGSKIAELLATSDRQRKPEPKERVRSTPAGLDQWMRENFRKGNKRDSDHQGLCCRYGSRLA
jgi:hypothetical protein